MTTQICNGRQPSEGKLIESSFQNLRTATKAGQSHEETMQMYNKWAKTYDEDLTGLGYKGPTLAADNLAKLGLPKDIQILDLPTGTGLCALVLYDNHGFTNIDGLDACPGMIAEAEKLNIYRKIYCAKIGDGNLVREIADNTYDAVTFAAGLTSGQIKLDAYEEMIRVCKPGGYIVTSMREEYKRTITEYLHMDEYLLELEQRGLWKKIGEYITPNYILDLEGLTLVHQVTKP